MRTLACFVLVALAGCSLADPELFRRLADGGETPDTGGVDAGMDAVVEEDSGTTQPAVDRCGTDDVFVITDTMENIAIDTTAFVNDVGSLTGCGNLSTPGPEGFFAVDVTEGEEWHFHLRVDEANDPDPTSRNPTLYVFNASCSSTMCADDLLANFCDAQQDEHFAFTFETSGRFFIGIDDTNRGGGAYLLDAIRPNCGNGVPEHGEACEGQAGCSSDCRWMVTEDSREEQGFNFNFKEANRIVLPVATNELEVIADIGGFEGCGYPDVFAVDIPDGGRLEVEQRDGSGSPCSGVGSPDLTLTLRNANNDNRGGDVVSGCPVIDETFATGGLFFVVVEDERPDISRALNYRLNFRVTP
ncbi:MAG: hypothetical protein AAGE52_09395 [Myxococcota bacterium]